MAKQMGTQQGLLVRGTAYYFQARIPKNLLPLFPEGTKQIARKKLTAKTLLEAKQQVQQRLADLNEKIHLARTTGSIYKQSISDQAADHLIGLALHSRLKADEELRADGLDDAGWKHLETIKAETEATEKAAIARGQLTDQAAAVAEDWLTSHGYNIPTDSPDFKAFAMRFHKAMSGATKVTKARDDGEWIDTPVAPVAKHRQAPKSAKDVLLLSEVIKYFLDNYDKTKPMYLKHKVALPLFLELLGDVDVTTIKQMDIEGFFNLILKLPPRWKDQAKKLRASVRELTELEWPLCMSPKSFEGTYLASIRALLKASKRSYRDRGFPSHLTTEGCIYQGNRKEGEQKQRELYPDEVKKLFSAIQPFSKDKQLDHQFWFPMIGLYTGARVNEVCQLNPQTDIREEGGIWLFEFTDESPTAQGVRKRTKNTVSKRQVPIHSKLIELGFLDYVERLNKTGALLLFPMWKIDEALGKASSQAEDWMVRFIKQTGLRDETLFRTVKGFHCFRSTFSNRLYNADVPDYAILTGQADATPILRGYRGQKLLEKKQEMIEKLDYGLDLSHLKKHQ